MACPPAAVSATIPPLKCTWDDLGNWTIPATLHSHTSRPFDKAKNGRIAVEVINHLGDEVMKVFKIA
jgi:hypothetical protein